MLAPVHIVHSLYVVSCYDTNEYGFGCDQRNYKTRKPLAANGIIHGMCGIAYISLFGQSLLFCSVLVDAWHRWSYPASLPKVKFHR